VKIGGMNPSPQPTCVRQCNVAIGVKSLFLKRGNKTNSNKKENEDPKA